MPSREGCGSDAWTLGDVGELEAGTEELGDGVAELEHAVTASRASAAGAAVRAAVASVLTTAAVVAGIAAEWRQYGGPALAAGRPTCS